MTGDGREIVAGAAIFAAMSALIYLRRHWRNALRFLLVLAGIFILLAFEFCAVVTIVAFAFVGIGP